MTPGRIELACRPFSRVVANRSEIDGVVLRKGRLRTYVRLDSSTPGISRFVFWSYSPDDITELLTRNGWSFRTEVARRFETPLFGR